MNIVITNYSFDSVISGGDVIAAEYARCWKDVGNHVVVATHQTGASFFRSRGVENSMLVVVSGASSERLGVLIAAFVKTLSAIFQSFFWKGLQPELIFSSSWMWTDLFPALILKMKYPKSKLVVGLYLLLNPPRTKSYGSTLLNRWVLWIVFLVGFGLVRHFADMSWTASLLDAKYLRKRYGIKTFAVRGGVDVLACKKVRGESKKFDAVFMGRFHPQKNISELLDIWKLVNTKDFKATLLLIGDGFLREDINNYIKSSGLEDVVKIEKMLDGDIKFKTLAQAEIFVSASHYDTGNLSLDEAMACGVSGIVYDIPRLYYPKGVIKVKCFDKSQFAKNIIYLLKNDIERDKLSKEAQSFGETLDWKISAKKALMSVKM